MRPDIVASFLLGAVCGVATPPMLVGVWLWWREVGAAVSEGAPLVGEELERAKRKEP